MTSKQVGKHGRRHRTRVNVDELYLNGNTGFAMAEFYALLEDSEFVARVIEIYHSDRSSLDSYSEPADSSAMTVEIQEDSQWETLVKKHLADWLFRITDILTMQAKFASRGYPMSHAQLAALIADAFLMEAAEDLQLRDGRNELWNAYTMKLAINSALPEIKTEGAVTLTNVAKKINARFEEISHRSKKPLSGKHLQKLLKVHNIDWMAIKRSYKKHLAAQRRDRNSKHELVSRPRTRSQPYTNNYSSESRV
jgi:hypothetical protein